jgi:adenylosuccinate synthase
MKKRAYIVVDLGYGDQGKGTTVDFLARQVEPSTIVRFNGGCQAAHHVVTADGRSHCFSQFGSGMFVNDTTTYLSRHMLIAPKSMLKEAASLEKLGVTSPLARTFIDHEAPIISPFQQSANRIIEAQRGNGAHGSCGCGIGETMEDILNDPQFVIRAGDLHYPDLVRQKLQLLKEHKWAKLKAMFDGKPLHPDAANEFHDCFIQDGTIEYFLGIYAQLVEQVHIVSRSAWKDIANQDRPLIFEGAQGVLLDEWHGFHPHTTWSNCTFANADEMLAEIGYSGEVTKVGVTRAYSTRHGAGPFATNDDDMTRRLPETHNVENRWQGGMRAGWLDLVALSYASDVVGHIDYLSVTCLDRIKPLGEVKVCTNYRLPNGQSMHLVHSKSKDLIAREKVTKALATVRPEFEDLGTVDSLLAAIYRRTGVQPGIYSYGPTAEDKEMSMNLTDAVRT